MTASDPAPSVNLTLVPLPAQRLADSAYALLREHILRGSYRPGQRLRVDQLARDLGVSQTPIKTALGALVAESLIEVRPRRGTFISVLSERDISETFDIRTALELLAAEAIAARATAPDILMLRTLAERTAEAADKVDEHFRNNAAFHQHLIELSGNRRLAELYRRLNAHIQIALIHSQSTSWQSRVPTETAEHEAMVQAIEARDTNAIKQAISRHLKRAQRSLVDQIRSEAPGTQQGGN